jgi:hypothetical protein
MSCTGEIQRGMQKYAHQGIAILFVIGDADFNFNTFLKVGHRPWEVWNAN